MRTDGADATALHRALSIKTICLAAIVAAIPAAALAIADEVRLHRAIQVMRSPSGEGRDDLLARREPGRGAAPSPREALVLASLTIEQAAADESRDGRDASLRRADRLLAIAQAGLPRSAAAEMLRCRLALARAGSATPAAIGHLAASYRHARFLRQEGMWRAAFAARYWNELPPAIRDAAIDEALWLASVNQELRQSVDAIVVGSGMALPVSLRLMHRDSRQRGTPAGAE